MTDLNDRAYDVYLALIQANLTAAIDDSKHIMRSEIYNILYHQGPKSVADISDILHSRMANNMVTRPHITGIHHKILLIQEAMYAKHMQGGQPLAASPYTLYVSGAEWFEQAIEQDVASTLDMLLEWAISQHCDAMWAIATRHKLGGPVLVVDKDDDLRSLINISGGEATSDGNVYTLDQGNTGYNWCFYSKEYQLWFYNSAVLAGWANVKR